MGMAGAVGVGSQGDKRMEKPDALVRTCHVKPIPVCNELRPLKSYIKKEHGQSDFRFNKRFPLNRTTVRPPRVSPVFPPSSLPALLPKHCVFLINWASVQERKMRLSILTLNFY